MLGVATLIVVMAVLNGFRAELLDKILGFSGHATFYHQDLSPIPDFKEIQARLEKVDGRQAGDLARRRAGAWPRRCSSNTGVLVRGIAEADIEKLTSINNKDLQTSIAEPGIPDLTPSFEGSTSRKALRLASGWRGGTSSN